jgi:hypothetical protein
MNKYTKWYNQITDRARYRIIEGYTEKHHIKPRSLGGTDDADNLVELTAREHFICHWLLTKMTTGEDRAKMIYALNGMKRSNKFALYSHGCCSKSSRNTLHSTTKTHMSTLRSTSSKT